MNPMTARKRLQTPAKGLQTVCKAPANGLQKTCKAPANGLQNTCKRSAKHLQKAANGLQKAAKYCKRLQNSAKDCKSMQKPAKITTRNFAVPILSYPIASYLISSRHNKDDPTKSPARGARSGRPVG
jgi:conjugal transfer/entry exclusion protein